MERERERAVPGGRTAVLVVDLQREFVEPGAPFPVPGAEAIVGRLPDFLARARAAGAAVVFTAYQLRDGVPAGLTTRRFPVPDAHRGELAALVDALPVRNGDVVVAKSRMSAFYATDLEVVLRGLGVERVVITGVTTHMCCLSTAFDAAARDFEVVVVSDLTASPAFRDGDREVRDAPSVHAAALDLIAYGLGTVATSDEALALLAPAAEAAPVPGPAPPPGPTPPC